jgi:hypothetical protein
MRLSARCSEDSRQSGQNIARAAALGRVLRVSDSLAVSFLPPHGGDPGSTGKRLGRESTSSR